MKIRYLGLVHSAALLILACVVVGAREDAKPVDQGRTPISTQWLLNSVRTPQEKNHIKSVLMLVCSTSRAKGTAFLLRSGIVVTNEHVVSECSRNDLWALSPMGMRVTFAGMVTDKDRDLALLLPVERLEGGLELGEEAEAQVGDEVCTWGFPFNYEDPAPLFSNGYVAGFAGAQLGNRTVRRLIVNGAFNPGNSGGPLILKSRSRVVGVVVEKWTLRSPLAEEIIKGFSNPSGAKTTGNFNLRLPDGTTRPISDQEAIGAALAEFYKRTQVMIGEAISVTELREFVREKEVSLRTVTHK